MIIATHISHITDVMAIAFGSEMVNNSIQFICPNHLFRVAHELYLLFNVYSVIYLLISALTSITPQSQMNKKSQYKGKIAT